ncbi:MAG: dipeptide epimerase [Alphaproteobacteria bacterium]|nr:dipeptide epimerase [Alphaproteobacteria bacterium]
MTTTLSAKAESFPIRGTFTISRGSKTAADVVLVEARDGAAAGRGECVPYPRYNETVEGALADIARLPPGVDRAGLGRAMKAGAARNAVDCALWDLEAKRSGTPAWKLAGLPEPGPVVTAYTLSLDTPEAMGKAAAGNAHRPLLKLKLAGEGDIARVEAVRRNAPKARLIVDANEGWKPEMLPEYVAAMARLGVELIEQPLPAGKDDALAGLKRDVVICADESCHGIDSLAALRGRYDAVNIKLDKTGGLTEALAVAREARRLGFKIMIGCMLGTSLAMAPALLVAQLADFVDLDGPLLLAKDRPDGIEYRDGLAFPPKPALWG